MLLLLHLPFYIFFFFFWIGPERMFNLKIRVCLADEYTDLVWNYILIFEMCVL